MDFMWVVGFIIAIGMLALVLYFMIKYSLLPYCEKAKKGFLVKKELKKLDRKKYKVIRQMFFEHVKLKRFVPNVIVSNYGVFVVNAQFVLGKVEKIADGKFVNTVGGAIRVLNDYTDDNEKVFLKIRKLSKEFDGVKFYSVVALPNTTEICVEGQEGFYGKVSDVVAFIESRKEFEIDDEKKATLFSVLSKEDSRNHQ